MVSYLLLSILWLMMAMTVTYLWGSVCEMGEVEQELKRSSEVSEDGLEEQTNVMILSTRAPRAVREQKSTESSQLEALH